MKIKDLPEDIKKLALANQVAQGNAENLELFVGDGSRHGNFLWDESPEGYEFWNRVDNYRFEEARKLLPPPEKSPVTEIVYTETEVKYLFKALFFEQIYPDYTIIWEQENLDDWFNEHKKK